jgi:hypothetical protein
MLVDKIIYDLKESLRAHSNDTTLTNSRLLHLVDTTRAKYIRQHQVKNLGESKLDYIQTLFLETERVDRSYLPSVPIGKQILRTVKEVPRFIGRNIFKNVEIRPIDRIHSEIEYMDKQRAVYAGAYFNDDTIVAFIDSDRRMYFITKDTVVLHLKRVAVDLILEVPDDITEINELTEALEDYPIAEHLWNILKPEIVEMLYKELGVRIDTVDDNKTPQ